ncbi:DNA-directed RNA polymerase II subunit RPB1-like [Penaeus chinensis]|uniref:DNA-directed RNA polymerase II subunit RPB1-like n=1 Tax=Penaeus chinensis TaxID=139456 RepID=UPI001FB60DCB|nr:DNA-directed RNA polymerase II subunit RPB1-like [Penaeus chinensis]
MAHRPLKLEGRLWFRPRPSLFKEFTPTSTEFTPTSTEFTPTSTEFTPTSTEFTPASTEFTPTSTEFTPTSTEFTPASTEFTPTSTEFTPASTDFIYPNICLRVACGSDLDRVSSKAFANSTPAQIKEIEFTPTSTEFTPTSTEFTPTSTEFTPTSTEFTPASTEFTPTSTEFTPTSTEFTPASTEFTPTSTEFTPASTDFIYPNICRGQQSDCDGVPPESSWAQVTPSTAKPSRPFTSSRSPMFINSILFGNMCLNSPRRRHLLPPSALTSRDRNSPSQQSSSSLMNIIVKFE